MISIRRANERGKGEYGWLHANYTFSFAHYYDPRHVGFHGLVVMNEDYIEGGGGFPEHGHRDMEIVTYILEGALRHRDSMGNEGVIRPGVVQRMSAGTGVRHSEFNDSKTETCHLYQIWIEPSRGGFPSGYEERALPGVERAGKLVLVASPDGANGSTTINADTKLYCARLEPGQTVTLDLAKGRHGWLQVARGAVALNGEELNVSDGAAISNVQKLEVTGREDSEILLFDLR